MTGSTRGARDALLEWYSGAKRDLPWRRTRDPYRILVSEVMLQQTRVAAVLPYYERFLARFPTAASLAVASESEVLTLWSGLGYYSRARNLHEAAKAIAEGGEFPRTYDAIRGLKGVGDYTAAAVASICFDLPHVVVDGNVLRVMSRLLAEKGDIRGQSTRERIRKEAQRLLHPDQPGEFNQALMELGATICLPKDPLCLICPWKTLCEARAQGMERELPVKLRARAPVNLRETVLLLRKRQKVLLRQRHPQERPMAGFWELPSFEHLPGAILGATLGRFCHSITHHRYVIEVREARIRGSVPGMIWKPVSELGSLPLSTVSRKALLLAHVTTPPKKLD